jgi:hypothetical protein
MGSCRHCDSIADEACVSWNRSKLKTEEACKDGLGRAFDEEVDSKPCNEREVQHKVELEGDVQVNNVLREEEEEEEDGSNDKVEDEEETKLSGEEEKALLRDWTDA